MSTFKQRALTPLAAAALAVFALAACSTLPADNAALMQARSNYQAVQNDPQSSTLAAGELKAAGDALALANAAFSRKDSVAEVDHLAYIANQRVGIAQETTRQKAAEAAVAGATAQRDQIRLTARTNEADAAQRSAAAAQQDAAASQRQSEESKRMAAAAQQSAVSSQQQASDAQVRNQQLEAQIKDMNAKKTGRGLVITIGDVLFDTNRADLKPGAERNMDKLVAFLQQYPQRKALVEGFTDNVGSEDSNQTLSGRRADAVRSALLSRGVGGERVSTKGYGEAYPVAGNDNAAGRQSNRRVEIILSDDSGSIGAR
jgi:outer membrane protein OmpA-like peptidoglycan-associated protein